MKYKTRNFYLFLIYCTGNDKTTLTCEPHKHILCTLGLLFHSLLKHTALLFLSALLYIILLGDYFFLTLCLGFLVSVLGNQLASISEMSGTVDLSLKAFIWDCIS